MKTKQNRKVSVSLIFILVIAMILTPVSQIFASNNSSVDTSSNSGGFIIETVKVDGSMDLVGALTGNITIYEGEIHGLTITKVMERGNGLEPLVVRISSPGPIPVKNLNAKTINNELPNIGGLCKPSQLGRICMENVVMNVEEQFVETISLTNANIYTCYLSECDALPTYNSSISPEQVEELLNGNNDESEQELQEIVDQIEKQEKYVEQLDGLLTSVSDMLNELSNQEYVGKIQDVIKEVEHAVENNLGLDELMPTVQDLSATLEFMKSQLLTAIGLLDEGGTVVEEVDNSMSSIEKILLEKVKKREEQNLLQEQLGEYVVIAELAKKQKAGDEVEYSLDELEGDKKVDDELQALVDRFDNLKTIFVEKKKWFEELTAEYEALNSEYEKAEKDVNGLKELLEQLGLESDKEVTDDGILDSVKDPVEENVLDPVKDKVVDPILDPVEENILDPIKEEVADPILDPVKDNILDPVEEAVLEPILDPITGKLLDPVTGEVIDLILDPVSIKLLDPITGKIVIPIWNPFTGKIINPLTGEVVEKVFNKDTGELLDPYKDSILKKILEKIFGSN
ncbi:hypothetical protein [Paucisalibacillus globulus]|uniref:hypothetical protein n=1 Tax=Paucisalibacillus globulus TaxID=351095 RepID=UPI0003F582CB|nr:hypothetical protein [Paucisalibacillus globulus]